MLSVVRPLATVPRQAPIRSIAAAAASLEKQVDTDSIRPRPLKRQAPIRSMTAAGAEIPKPPARYLNCFTMFYKENTIHGIHGRSLLRRLSSLWARLSVEEKKIYQDAHKESMSTYGERYKAFQQNLTDEQQRLTMAIALTRSYLSELRKTTGRPKAPSGSGYSLFTQDHYKNEDGSERTEDEYEKKLGHASVARNKKGLERFLSRSRELAQKWNSMRPEEQQPYRERSKQMEAERGGVYREWQQNTPNVYFEKLQLLRDLRRATKEHLMEPEKIKTLMEACNSLLDERKRGLNDER